MNGRARRRLYVMEMEDIYVWMTTAEIKSKTVILNIEEMWNISDSICMLKSTSLLAIICALFSLEPRVGGWVGVSAS